LASADAISDIQAEIGGLVVHDTSRIKTRERREVDEMESVVRTGANIADQERRTGRQQLMTGFPEAGAHRQIDDVADPSTKSVESDIVGINQQGAMERALASAQQVYSFAIQTQCANRADFTKRSRIAFMTLTVLTLDWPERFSRKSASGMTS
jgi:hypothetical protein